MALIFIFSFPLSNQQTKQRREKKLDHCRMMKQMNVEMKSHQNKKQMSLPPPTPPPLPPPLPTYWRKPASTTWSATKEEIALFWRRKRITEEEHFNAAIKAAARLRARNLTEEDYRRFEESLNDIDDNDKKNNDNDNNNKTNNDGMLEIRVGIKDWWTKSKYAYLNQPATESMDTPKKTSSYIPNSFFYKATPQPQQALLGVF